MKDYRQDCCLPECWNWSLLARRLQGNWEGTLTQLLLLSRRDWWRSVPPYPIAFAESGFSTTKYVVKRSRTLSREPGMRRRRSWKITSGIQGTSGGDKEWKRKLHGCCEQRLKEPADSSILQNAALSSLLTDFTTNLYIQIVYTIRKFCTLLKKIVHYTILSEQE